MVEVGARVSHGPDGRDWGHGKGTVIARNTQESAFYPPSEFPNVVKWDHGTLTEVYKDCELTVVQ